jgi:hypothetical protein
MEISVVGSTETVVHRSPLVVVLFKQITRWTSMTFTREPISQGFSSGVTFKSQLLGADWTEIRDILEIGRGNFCVMHDLGRTQCGIL